MAVDLVVRSSDGSVTVRRFDAADAASARARAQAQGLQVVGAGSATTGTSAGAGPQALGRWWAASTGRRFHHGDFAEELGTLLQAGLGILEALEAMRQGEASAVARRMLESLEAGLRAGRTLSAAMADAGGFPPLLVAGVRASERTGDLVTTLLRHAQHERRVRALTQKLLGAAIYPVLLMAVGAAVVTFLLGFVVPRFASLIESARTELPWASRMLMAWGAAVAEHPAWMLAAFLFAAAMPVALFAFGRSPRGGALLRRLPLISALARRFRLTQIYATAGMLVRGGLPADQALRQCAQMMHGRERDAVAQAAVLLHEGTAFSAAMQQVDLADPLTSRMLVVAERTGMLPEVLERVAAMHEARLQQAMEAASRLVEPLLMIAIGLVIGGIVVLMYLPIFDLAGQLQ